VTLGFKTKLSKHKNSTDSHSPYSSRLFDHSIQPGPALRGCGGCGLTGPPKTEGSIAIGRQYFFLLNLSILDTNTQKAMCYRVID
jgi:hypothetical protein